MSVQIGRGSAGSARQATVVPLRRLLPMLVRGPVNAFAEVGRQARGQVVRLDLGPFRPYLVTHPDHVQYVMRTDWTNYQRVGKVWDPVERFLGTTFAGEGPDWESSRKAHQPMFTARHVTSLTGRLADVIAERVDRLDESARSGRPIDATKTMTDIVVAVNTMFFFGEKSSFEEGERLAREFGTAVKWLNVRQIMPFVPTAVPLPGDRAFANAVKAVDEMVYPLIRKARTASGDGHDVISALCRARDGSHADDRKVRDDLVAALVAGTDTTTHALAWMWPVLRDHPPVAARLYDEIDRVVGTGPVLPSHIPELRYTKMVLQEVLRLYPSGWIMQRFAAASGEIGGVSVNAGSTVFVSPYATHRLDEFWDRPLDFDPERFSPDIDTRRHRYSYFPFGGGPHQCIGQHLFQLVALLTIATLVSRFRPWVRNSGPFTPLPAALRPKQKIELGLVPVERSPHRAR
ncbi:cytochrome P450 [Streptosporangium becharense]|uniref:Cytochrome P450 n=1 Tax=Streptosporangium becharense TaxID=1816182 RepID=A0A7W9MJH5_9ACTN|nr:cytochrome P450 [Streptosporangium becharense]MBB2910317.1 cytochrome P450 [Streptosporangium becharense]MBB5823060.1 cytochrome P450 [Streptosporangium becharense]